MAGGTTQQSAAGGAPQRPMTLLQEELLTGADDPEGLRQLIQLADQVVRTWQPTWSPFLEARLQEEALARLNNLSEIGWHRDGGYPGAERCRFLCHRRDQMEDAHASAPVQGLLIEGNFLFDPLSPDDIRNALQDLGAAPDQIGDLWVRGDRGGQGLCTPESAAKLHEQRGRVRDVEIRCEALPIEALHLPAQRTPRILQTVEASCRIDAIASAGFGLSRAKIVSHIKAGRLRMNWHDVRQASRDVGVGDRLQLQDRGTLEVLSLTRTKRERWRVELRRS
jgi:photosystem II S4 domain protein